MDWKARSFGPALIAYIVAGCGGGSPAGDAAPGDGGGGPDARLDGGPPADGAPGPDGGYVCTPNTVQCVGDDVVTCTADGTVGDRETCPLGCDASRTRPACWTLVASNLSAAAVCDTPAAGPLLVPGGFNTAIDTSEALLCERLVTQTGGPQICLRRFTTVNVAANATLRVIGARALAVVATGSFILDGTVDGSAVGRESGPGFFATGAGGSGAVAAAGGGGAGAGAPGAAGGTSQEPKGQGGAPGPETGSESLSPLVGGAPGGDNGAPSSDPTGRLARGGGGGGALQLVSCGTLSISGKIHVGGGGGQGGPGGESDGPGGGGGGGSGGAVLIEAAQVTITGTVAANGGGGGSGGMQDIGPTPGPVDGHDGADGTLDDRPAPGGAVIGGAGGSGGTGRIAPTPGAVSPGIGRAGGGGGGAAGRIRLNARPGTSPRTGGATLSPPPTTGEVARH